VSAAYKILLFYKYVPLENLEDWKATQKSLCQDLNIHGRILLASEGINGTLSGKASKVEQYQKTLESMPEFADMEWKISWAEEQVFPKLKILIRDEIVTLGVKKTGTDVSLEHKAAYIEPNELLELYENDSDFVIIDARNQYEAHIGKFKNSITPSIENFRDFPAFAKELEPYKDQEVITYCTGGVRCEKASAYLRELGFNNVRQLHGGIHEYGEQVGGKYFEGEMFVFDKRLHVPVNEVNPTIIAQCQYCATPITRYIDCAILSCDSLFICCAECEERYQATCSETCLQELRSLATN